MDDVGRLLDDARERLADVPQKRLGAVREPGRIRRAFGRRPVIAPVPAGSGARADQWRHAWHLGVLLVGDADLAATGSVLRAEEEVRRGFAAESQRERAALRAMAFRGGFATGETFHVDWTPLDTARLAAGGSAEPLIWEGARLMVRWSPAGFLLPLDDYLDERIRLAHE